MWGYVFIASKIFSFALNQSHFFQLCICITVYLFLFYAFFWLLLIARCTFVQSMQNIQKMQVSLSLSLSLSFSLSLSDYFAHIRVSIINIMQYRLLCLYGLYFDLDVLSSALNQDDLTLSDNYQIQHCSQLLCISTSHQVLHTLFAGPNNVFDADTTFSINFCHKM